MDKFIGEYLQEEMSDSELKKVLRKVVQIAKDFDAVNGSLLRKADEYEKRDRGITVKLRSFAADMVGVKHDLTKVARKMAVDLRK